MKHFVIIIFVCSSLLGCTYKGLPPLNQTFYYKDKNPFGTFVSYKLLHQAFSKSFFKVVESVEGLNNKEPSLYFSISNNFILNETELNQLLSFADKGNDVFISAYYFDTLMLNILTPGLGSNGGLNRYSHNYMTTGVSILQKDNSANKFEYFYQPFDAAFVNISDSNIIHGFNAIHKPNFIEINYGRGKIFLHNDPRAFSNYFLLSKNNYKYFEEVLNVIQINPLFIYWVSKEFSNSTQKPESALERLMKSPSLANGIWVALILLLLYIIFESRRKQRIIPIKEANANKSIEFAKVLSHLYLSKKNNKNISLKMISYFNEYCRNKFFINENVSSIDPKIISGKSGVSLGDVELLLETIRSVEILDVVPDELLLLLQTQINKFH